jgi:hypothetical protein
LRIFIQNQIGNWPSEHLGLFCFWKALPCSPGSGHCRAVAEPAALRGAQPHRRGGFRCSAYRAAAKAGACGPRGTSAPPASASVSVIWGSWPVHAGPSSVSPRVSLGRCLVSRQDIQAAYRQREQAVGARSLWPRPPLEGGRDRQVQSGGLLVKGCPVGSVSTARPIRLSGVCASLHKRDTVDPKQVND